MAMTVVVTRNVPGRFRGFLASCMCEVAPGVYTSPRLSRAVRERIWAVLEDWFRPLPEWAIVMTWPDRNLSGGQAFLTLGVPKTTLADLHGVFLAHRELTESQLETLKTSARDATG